ncbi:lecithin retinol acyltransferase family protein [Candidatus Venteria ishoeyi]|uniref:NC domain protein n=1 Tax=Candidatus Venteria ishoeyi TaxID=1899563 RepID=A0A1H6F5D2_9GAMM|nr:lecithin retinol acyltransferase family protein [Candidatus Venteria ishoeyi]SEH04591.1 NC domain protein [Candidatus Venteria ishoeyi]
MIKRQNRYPPGTILKIKFGIYFHYGIADGEGNVIHNSKKRMQVTCETESAFAEGRTIQVSHISSENPEKAVIKAKQYIGMPYKILKNNCEHFVRLAHGLESESPQIQYWIISAFAAAITIKSDNTLIQLTSGAVVAASLLTPVEQSPLRNAVIAGLAAFGIGILLKTEKSNHSSHAHINTY